MDNTLKIGIFPGSFNPIHNGHIELAKRILLEGHVNQVKFMISPKNPLKPWNIIEDPYHRYVMANIACKNINPTNTILSADNFEMAEFCYEENTYTANTFRKLIYSNIDSVSTGLVKYYCIMGSDTFNQIELFKDSDWLLNSGLMNYIVVKRPGCEIITPTGDYEIIYVENPFEENISSTMVREALKNKDNDFLNKSMDSKVLEYIKMAKLYR